MAEDCTVFSIFPPIKILHRKIRDVIYIRVVIWFTCLSDMVSGSQLLYLYNISCVKYQTIKGQIIFAA